MFPGSAHTVSDLRSAAWAAPPAASAQAIKVAAPREKLTVPLFIANSPGCGDPMSPPTDFDPNAGRRFQTRASEKTLGHPDKTLGHPDKTLGRPDKTKPGDVRHRAFFFGALVS